MIRKDVDVHLEALAGYINDEDKLVTYKWLSKELGIHVNLSKQILYEYWDKQRQEKEAISATFLLIGYHEDGGMRVDVVKEADLPAAKKNLSKIVSEHVYSLQKTLPEIELLAIADKGNSEHSAVRCNEAVIRSEHEMEVLRWGSVLHSNRPVAAPQRSTAKNQKQTNSEMQKLTEQTKESTAKTTASKPQEKTQKNAFNNMFAKAIDKQNKEKTTSGNKKSKAATPPKNAWFEAAKKPKIDQPPKSKVEEKSGKADNESVSATSEKKSKVAEDTDDLADSPRKNSWSETKSKPKSRKEQHAESSGGSEEPMTADLGREDSPEKGAASGKIVGSKKKAAPSSSSSRGKKRQSTAKKESNSKRRKRIIVAESSEESSGSDAEDIRETEYLDEPEPPVIEKIKTCPSPPLVKCEAGRRKVRKLIDKTFMDADGYFVTQKEYVYESCSDKEEEVQEKISKPANTEPAAVKNNNKRKQATLLNFFKKS